MRVGRVCAGGRNSFSKGPRTEGLIRILEDFRSWRRSLTERIMQVLRGGKRMLGDGEVVKPTLPTLKCCPRAGGGTHSLTLINTCTLLVPHSVWMA